MKRIVIVAAALGMVAVAAPAFAAPAVQGGVEGEAGVQAFSGPLSDALRAGPAWGADAQIKPNIPLGLEVRYQGASNQLFGSGNFFNGPRAARVVQNGGEALAHVSIAPNMLSSVEPYLAGGIGFSRFSLSNPVPGYKDDTLGDVPVSAGVNFHPHIAGTTNLTVGLRGDYKWLFSDQFAPTNVTTDYGLFTKQGGDTYRGEITIGGAF